MGQNEQRFSLQLSGAFRLTDPLGSRVAVRSKRGQALIAMLATATKGERTRAWLQSRLWGSRGEAQAQASLRRELSTLRQTVNACGTDLLHADNGRVWIDFNVVEIDIYASDIMPADELLEGFDLSGEECFEDWLREERSRLADSQKAASARFAIHSQPSAESFTLRPAIAVLPFVPADQNDQAQSIAHGLSEDLIDRLSRLRWLPVIARSSSFAAGSNGANVQSAGNILGARYVVEGSFRSEGIRHRLTTTLVDAESGQAIWSNRALIALDADRDATGELLMGIAAALGLSIDQIEQQRATRIAEPDLSVRDLIWRGRWHLNRLAGEDIIQAKACFAEALAREPNSSEALIQVAWAQLWDLWLVRGDEARIREVRRMAQQAIIADYEDARGHMLAGIAEIWLKQPLRAEALLRRAIELNPSLVMAHCQLGTALNLKGDHKAAIENLNFAFRLSPNDHDLFFIFGELATAHLLDGSYAVALEFAEQSLTRRAAYWMAHIIKINALIQLDRAKDAQVALRDLQSAKTGFRSEYIDWVPFLDSGKRDFLKQGLNRAGHHDD